MKMEVRELKGGEGTVVTVSGEVGFSEVDALKAALDRVLDGPARMVLIDMGGLNFIASDGLGTLIRVRAHAEKAGKGFILVRPQARIKDLLEKTGLSRIFCISETLESAMTNSKL